MENVRIGLSPEKIKELTSCDLIEFDDVKYVRLDHLKRVLAEISDENGALLIPDVSGLLPFDEAALKREYNLETYGKMTDYDRKQLWIWFVGKLKGNNH